MSEIRLSSLGVGLTGLNADPVLGIDIPLEGGVLGSNNIDSNIPRG